MDGLIDLTVRVGFRDRARFWAWGVHKMQIFSGYIALLALASAICSAGTQPEAQEKDGKSSRSASFATEYDSKYIFRGVNSLPGSGIAVTELELAAGDFSIDIWQAIGLSKHYDEWDFTLTYEREIAPFTLSAGYVNYYTPDDDHLKLGYADTQEFFATVAYDFRKLFTTKLTYNYDFDKIGGGFLELRSKTSVSVVKDRVSLEPYVSISYDFHYNSDTQGWNSFQIGLDVPISLAAHFTIKPFAAFSFPLSAIDEFAKKEGWGGVSIAIEF